MTPPASCFFLAQIANSSGFESKPQLPRLAVAWSDRPPDFCSRSLKCFPALKSKCQSAARGTIAKIRLVRRQASERRGGLARQASRRMTGCEIREYPPGFLSPDHLYYLHGPQLPQPLRRVLEPVQRP